MNKILKFALAFSALYIFSSCSNGSYIIVDDEDHNFSEWIEEKATCTKDGVEGHYHCDDCGKDFDKFFEEIIGGAKTIKSGHELIHNNGKEPTGYKTGTKEYYVCSKCGKYYSDKECVNEIEQEDLVIPCKTLSVKEIKEQGIVNETCTVRAVVIGATGNTDGGHIYYILKDENSNEQIMMRSFKEQDFINGENKELSCTKGYSYGPSLVFQPGDIIEAPVRFANNGGTIKSGGEYNKEFLLWQGEDYTQANAQEHLTEWNNRYIVGHTDDYAIDKAQVTKTIRSQEDLESLLGTYGFQNYTICFEGTDANPLKFVTGCKDGVEDIDREYLYFFYDNPTSLEDVKVGQAYPVFSNFGNTFSMYSPLSTLLCDQREYEEPNFNHPYEFVGKIYATCVGGNSSYYHFVCMSEDDIINTNHTGSHAVISERMARNVFFDYMENKAGEWGVSITNPIFTAIGTSYVVNPEEFAKLLVGCYNTPVLQKFYNELTADVTIYKKDGTIKNTTVTNTVLSNENCINYIASKYEIIGTKGGSLAGETEERPYEVLNNIMLVKGPDNNVMVGCVCMHRGASDPGETPVYDVYLEMSKLFDIMVKKYNHEDTTELENSLLCYSCAGIMIPENGIIDPTVDIYGENSPYIHFSTDSASTKIVTASCWKMFTSACFLSIVPEEDLDNIVEFSAQEENSMVNKAPDLFGGDKLSYRDALFITLLPSSNDTPTFLARCGGEYLIRAMFNN